MSAGKLNARVAKGAVSND